MTVGWTRRSVRFHRAGDRPVALLHSFRIVRVPLVGAVVLALLGMACASDQPEVTVAEVQIGSVTETVAAAARVHPVAQVTITAPTSATVDQFLVTDGQTVVPGEPLVRLLSDNVEQQVEQAQAALDAATALVAAAAGATVDLSPVLGGFRTQLDTSFPATIAALEAQIAVLEAGAGPLTGDDLDEAIVSARESLTEVEAAFEDARVQLDAAERQTRQQAQQASAAQRTAAEAQRRQAEIALAAAQARAEDLTILAPIGGVVELRRGDDAGGSAGGLDAGALGGFDLSALATPSGPVTRGMVAEGLGVAAGEALLTIYDVSAFVVRAEADELDVLDIAVGQAVTVRVDALPTRPLEGTVAHVALASTQRAGAAGRMFPVWVELAEVAADVRLRAGLTASAEIAVRSVDNALLVPTSALSRRGATDTVGIVVDGVLRLVPVIVVAIGEESAAVEGEIEPGDLVIVGGLESLEDGEAVIVGARR